MSVLIAELPVEVDPVIEEINCRLRLVRHAALAFFASAWADWNDEYGDVNVSGKEIMGLMPDDLDPAALQAAHDLLEAIEKYDGTEITELFGDAVNAAEDGDSPCDEEHFAHYLAMSAMGHGVGLESVGLAHDWCHIPYLEFGSCSLDPVKYPMPGDD